jgi:hypothetical protein
LRRLFSWVASSLQRKPESGPDHDAIMTRRGL